MHPAVTMTSARARHRHGTPFGSSEQLSDLYVPLKTIQEVWRTSAHLREVGGASEAVSTLSGS